MDETLQTHEASRPDFQQPESQQDNIIDLTETVQEVLRHASLEQGVKESISEALYFVELPLQDPSSYSEVSVDAALSLRRQYPALCRYRELCIQALTLFCEAQRESVVTQSDAEAVILALSLFLSKRTEYERIMQDDVHEALTASIGDLVASKSSHIRRLLHVDDEDATHWDTLVGNLKGVIPVPTGEIETENPKGNFLHLRHQELSQSRAAVLNMFREYVVLLDINPNDKVSEADRTIMISSLFEYARKKDAYLSDLEANYKTSEPLKGAIFSGLGELTEELTEDHLDQYFGRMRGIELTRASATVRAALARAGMTETPLVLQTLLRGATPGAQLLRETLRVVSPQSYASVLFYALYLFSSEDKTKAVLTYSMFLGAGQALDLAPGVLESIAARIPALARYSPRIAKTKMPMPAKLGILLLAAWGFGEHIDNVLTSVERNADPSFYDLSGNVMGVLTTPLDAFPTWGVTFGMTDPLQDQLSYLTYEPAIAGNAPFTTFDHRIDWWDSLVAGYAREEKNPLRRKLIEHESIRNGPGGIEGWKSRRAFEYYRDLQHIISIEESVNADLVSLGIGSGVVSLSSRLRDTERATGDRNVREAITHLEPYDSMYADIDSELSKVQEQLKAQKKPELVEKEATLQALRKMYQVYEALAKQLDQERSNYVKLGMISQDWFSVSSDSSEETGTQLPDIVRNGMISEMVYQGRRRQALQIPDGSAASVSTLSRHLAENYTPDGPPSIFLDAPGWLSYFAVSGKTWDERIDRATSHDALNEFINRLSASVPKDTYTRIFEPLVKTILEQRVANYDPHSVLGPLATEYADAMFDGPLRSGQNLILLHNSSSKDNTVTLPHLYFYGEPRNLSDFPKHVHSTDQPVIVCSNTLSSDSSVTAVMEFQYDEQSDHWNVLTTSVGSIQFAAGGLTEPTSRRTENGTYSKTESFSTWRLRHPEFAAQVFSSMNSYREKRNQEKIARSSENSEGLAKELLEQNEAKEAAKKQPGVWIPFPSHFTKVTERRSTYVAYLQSDERDTGYFAYLRTPEVQTGPVLRSGDPAAQKAIGSPHTTRIEIIDERTGEAFFFNSMHGDYVEFFEKQKSSIPKEILTRSVALPIPDNAKGSVRTVLALYVHNISENENRAVEDALVRLYNSQNTLQEKTEFLHRFERLCRNQTQHGKLVLTPSLCTAILKVYRPYLMGKYSGVGAEVFAQGDEILGVLPDENGVYTVNKSTRKDVSPMHLQWNGVSWKWHPGTSSFNPHPDRWYDVHEVNIAWGRGDGSIGTSSPTEGNMDLLRRLQSLQ